MHLLKKIFNALTFATFLSIALCVALYQLQDVHKLLEEKDHTIKTLEQDLTKLAGTFDALKLEYGAFQNESRKREGDLMRELQDVREALKNRPEPAPTNPPPENSTEAPAQKVTPPPKTSKRSQ